MSAATPASAKASAGKPATFYARIDQALANPRLQAAVRGATQRMAGGRQTAVAALPEMDALRDHARAIRAHTIAHLDRYLRQFAESVERRGGHVHFAATAEEAVAIVREIAARHDVKTVVKGKSMVSEEIELNAGLERAGVEVIETDLGEFIVQLDGDHPSHIVMPIIHKDRHDVARLFRRTLNATEDEVQDAPRMAGLARRVLRAGFLRADMGISGGNFGVAATGSVCITTNEGNGRLTTSVPRVHIALMGIERLVPNLDDLGVMLQVLGRSATGQQLTVYSNVMSGPRRYGRAGQAGLAGQAGQAGCHRSWRRRVRTTSPTGPSTSTWCSWTTGAARWWAASWRRSCTASGAARASTAARSTSSLAATPMAACIPARSAPC